MEWDWIAKHSNSQVRVDLKEKDGETMVSRVKERTEFKISSKKFKGGSWDQTKSRVRKARAVFTELAPGPLRVRANQVRDHAASNMEWCHQEDVWLGQ